MAAGVGVHTVLHLRWLAHMTRRIASGDAKRKARIVPAGGGRRAGAPATAVVRCHASGTPVLSSPHWAAKPGSSGGMASMRRQWWGDAALTAGSALKRRSSVHV